MAGKKTTRPAEKTLEEERLKAAVLVLAEAISWRRKGTLSLRGVDYRLANAVEAYEKVLKACHREST